MADSKPSQDIRVDYDDKRLTQVESQKTAALNNVNATYDKMINQSDKYYQKQIDAAKEWGETQAKNQQERSDFTIEQIEQQKEQAKKDYTKEQSGAYVDWQKQSGEYGANAEMMAEQGMGSTGYSESSQVSMYNTYQNRVATARESYNRAVLNYDNAIKDAQLQNNAALAEIAYQSLQTQLELSLEGFQYKNSLVMAKMDKGLAVDSEYHGRYQDVLKQINTENALAEEVRQYNASLEEEKRQYNQSYALQQAQLAEEKRQFNETMAYNKSKSNGSGGGGSSGGSGGKFKSGGSGKKSYSEGKDTSAHFSTQKDRETNAKQTVTNRHTDSWVEVGSAGRFSWTEVLAHVKDGSIKEVKSGNKITYKWVGKKSSGNGKNVTPDKKGYAAKQYNLFYGSGAR